MRAFDAQENWLRFGPHNALLQNGVRLQFGSGDWRDAY